MDRLLAATFEAYGSEGEWTGRLRAALETLLGQLADRPAVARLCFVDVLGAGGSALAARDEAMKRLARLFEPLPAQEPEGPSRELLALAVAGGLSEVLYREVAAGRTAELPERLPDLLFMSVLPLCGSEAARAAAEGKGC